MTLKEFLQNDIFRNTLVAKPHFEFVIAGGKVIKINDNPGAYIGASLSINSSQLVNFGMFDFSQLGQSFMISFL